MIRYMGIFIIGGVCIWCGFSFSDRLKIRSVFLRQFISALLSAEMEICFCANNLNTIFKRLSKEPQLYGFFGDCLENMNEIGMKNAWEKACENIKERACLKDKDADIIRQLGKELGMSDVQGQKEAIERICSLLKINETEARDEYIRLSGVYRKCGVLTAAFAALILI